MTATWPPAGRIVALQVRHQNRMFWRTPIAAFFTLMLPLIMLVLFAALFDGSVDTPRGPIGYPQFFTGGLAAFAAASATFTNLATSVAIQRDDGILKRVRGTPIPVWVHSAGLVGSAVWMAAIAVVVMGLFGVVFYDVDIDAAKLPAAIVTFVVGVAAFAAMGLAVAALAPTGSSAPAVANATILPMAFVSDIWIPIEQDSPRWLRVLGDIFPLRHFATSMQDVLNPFVDAPGFNWDSIAIMAAWGAAGVIVAIRFHRWEPTPGATGRRTRRSRDPA